MRASDFLLRLDPTMLMAGSQLALTKPVKVLVGSLSYAVSLALTHTK